MSNKNMEVVSYDEAKDMIESCSRRLALLHLSYSKMLIEEFGVEIGFNIIKKVIKEYGIRIGEKTKKEVLDRGLTNSIENISASKSYAVPKFGMHERIENHLVEGKQTKRAYGCLLGNVWKEYGEEKLGRFYCYMDIAKYMSYNLNFKLIHTKTILDGHDYCELMIKKTTDKERKDFNDSNKDWLYIDK